MPIVEHAPSMASGVTQLQYVSDDVALGGFEEHPIMKALSLGMAAMGVACLLGVDRKKARWIGIAGVGLGLLRNR